MIYKLLNTIPRPIIQFIRPVYNLFSSKYSSELLFWKTRFELDNGQFQNSHFKRIMLAMAEQKNNSFLKGKIVADFGCGPRGSLLWADSAMIRIGIDVLADKYIDNFKDNIMSHGMIYLKSTEKNIPIPKDFVDYIFTINAMDHVHSFPAICKEIIRILKPGGFFIGSFNLEEPATKQEPQKLNEEIIKQHLLSFLNVTSYRISNRGPDGDYYSPFFTGDLKYNKGEKGILWAVAQKN